MRGFVYLPIIIITVVVIVSGALTYKAVVKDNLLQNSPIPSLSPNPNLFIPSATPSAIPTTPPRQTKTTSKSTPTPSIKITTKVKLLSSSSNSIKFGEVITLTGEMFGKDPGQVVFINPKGQMSVYGGSIQSWSDTQIKVSVPFLTGTNLPIKIEVITSTNEKSNQIDLILVGGQPQIGCISPASYSHPECIGDITITSKPGEKISISGSGFGDSNGQVEFSSNSCSITRWTENTIECTLPLNLVAGQEYGLQITTSDSRQSSFKYPRIN